MSETEGSLVQCDRCQKEISRSKVVMDKGVDKPELLKQAKDDDRDFVYLCPVCADVDMGKEENDVTSEMSNIRKFL